ncbi:transmembrane protein 6/97 [Lactifluus volemus]|nr:transmembrane protein 6/97 [Lactifluus volemus]
MTKSIVTARRPLTSRPMDLFYCVFFLIHIPSILLVDCQVISPKRLVPGFVQSIIPWYVRLFGDPIIGGTMGLFANGSELAWFKSFIYLQILFQLPVLFLGAHALWLDSRGIYGLLVLYGTATCMIALPCIATIINIPTTSDMTISRNAISITPAQRILLLSIYVPFFVIPLYLAIDMASRLQQLASTEIHACEGSKQD